MKQVKLIWDFRGPNAAPIAAHHVVHLKEFAVAESLENTICKTEEITPMHHIAYMVVNQELMEDLRARLKPNRGQYYHP